MDCSYCSQYGEAYGFKPIIIDIDGTMPGDFVANSSSDDESVQHASAVLPSPAPLPSSTSTPNIDKNNNNKGNGSKRGGATDADKGGASAEVNEMLNRVLEAVRQSPTDDKSKGVSVYKIKNYLRLQYCVRKDAMTRHLKPALEAALRKKLLLKTTGTQSVLVGSVKLNPATHKGSDISSESSSSADEDDEQEKTAPSVLIAELGQPENSRKKRKASDEDVVVKVGKKRMKA